jgi:hypothetical protein
MGDFIMPLQINGATSGSATIQSTDTYTNTLTLPSGTGTLLSTANPQSGGVIQVVNATYQTISSTSSSTFSDTGLTASITPKFATSKILVIANIAGAYKSGANAANALQLRLVRNSTVILNMEGILAYTLTAIANNTSSSTSYLDSPATASSTTYKIQFASASNTASVGINDYNSSNTEVNSTITLMEIAA